MAQEDPNRLVEWYQLLRRQVPVAREHLDQWVSAVRAEPVLLWETPAVRYTAYGVGGVLSLWIVIGIAGMLVPPPPAGAMPEATTADFHVVCTAPRCGSHFVIHREFGFRRFPVNCPKCRQASGANARPCNSDICRGRWVAPTSKPDGVLCPSCGRRFE